MWYVHGVAPPKKNSHAACHVQGNMMTYSYTALSSDHVASLVVRSSSMDWQPEREFVSWGLCRSSALAFPSAVGC